MNKTNKKSLIKFFKVFVFSLILFEVFELGMEYIFNIDFHNLNFGWLGWLGFIIFYGFKYHILCCLIPAIWAGYKCKHEGCEHDHCSTEK